MEEDETWPDAPEEWRQDAAAQETGGPGDGSEKAEEVSEEPPAQAPLPPRPREHEEEEGEEGAEGAEEEIIVLAEEVEEEEEEAEEVTSEVSAQLQHCARNQHCVRGARHSGWCRIVRPPEREMPSPVPNGIGSFNHNEDSLWALKQHELLQELSRWGVHAGCGHRDPVLGIKADNKASRIRVYLSTTAWALRVAFNGARVLAGLDFFTIFPIQVHASNIIRD